MLMFWWIIPITIAVHSFSQSGVLVPGSMDLEYSNIIPSDTELLRQAQDLFQEEKLLAAARVLRRVRCPQQHLNKWHFKLLKISDLVEEAVENFLSPPGADWKKQAETHGDFDTSIYFKVESGGRLTCRIETPIPMDMLVPILAVWNESSLYKTWIPSWTKPVRLGVNESKQILNDRRGHQIIQINCDVPWPMSNREVLMDVTAVDDIEATGCIIAKMQTLGGGPSGEDTPCLLPEGFLLPLLAQGAQRVDFDGSILFRACPRDHPNYENAREKFSGDLILMQYTMFFDAKMAAIPISMINFVTRVVIGRVWSMLLKVADEVRSGERIEHIRMIQQKASFYQWLEGRCHLMLDEKANHGVVPAIERTAVHPLLAEAFPNKHENEWTMSDALRMTL
jgi:hypothetical protein